MAKNLNHVLAENLRHFMSDKRMTQQRLAEKSGVGQTTISLYLNPENRKDSASGKPKSGKLIEVEMLAAGLGVSVSELLLDATPAQRELFKGFLALLSAADAKAPAEEAIQEVKPKRKRSSGKESSKTGSKQPIRANA